MPGSQGAREIAKRRPGPLQPGIVLMCFGLPLVASGPVAGRILDRRNPRLLLAADNAARGMLIAVVPVLLWLHHLVVAELYGIAVASALLAAVTEVAEAALVPRMVDDEQLDTANSLLAANWELASLAGPVVSGVIVAVAGAGFALLLDAINFAVTSALCLSLPAFRPVRTTGPAQRAEGRNRLGPGILLRFPAARRGRRSRAVRPPAPWLRIGVVIASGAPLFGLLRVAPDLPAAAILLGLAAFVWGPYLALDRTLVQRLVPDDVRSRLVGARMTISSLGFPLGSAIGGALIGPIGVPAMILAIAGGYLALGSLPLLTSGLRAYPAARPLTEARQNAERPGPVPMAAIDQPREG